MSQTGSGQTPTKRQRLKSVRNSHVEEMFVPAQPFSCVKGSVPSNIEMELFNADVSVSFDRESCHMTAEERVIS